ncbi:MAG TPA: SEC-C metal-binding domain-containing protein, partial [Steroidobacteraceae bacterium]
SDSIAGIRHEVVNNIIDRYIPPKSVEEMWDIDGLVEALAKDFAIRLDIKDWIAKDENLNEEELRKRVLAEIDRAYEAKVQQYGAPIVRYLEKAIMLQQLDHHWREHLAAMDYLRQGIHLRSYAQKNPKQEYKREAFELFTSMLDRIKHDTVSLLSRMQLRTQEEIDAEEAERQRRLAKAMQFQHATPENLAAPPSATEVEEQQRIAPATPFVRESRKVGRNEPCPCGSGKKYKHCHGALAQGR